MAELIDITRKIEFSPGAAFEAECDECGSRKWFILIRDLQSWAMLGVECAECGRFVAIEDSPD